MSDLRKHLDAAKKEYQSLKYSGDLAEEILTPRRSRIDVLIRIGAVAAMAAAVVIAARVHMNKPTSSVVTVIPVAPTDPDTEAQTDEQKEIEVATFGELPAMSLPQGVSEGIDLAPASPDFSFSAPSFTLISTEEDSQSTSTTRESV